MKADAELRILNRQRLRRMNTRLLREILGHLLQKILNQPRHILGFHIVRTAEMTRVNERFLNHTGATDVLTFNHSHPDAASSTVAGKWSAPLRLAAPDPPLHGEVYICIDVAIDQAGRFKTSWQSEIIRYATHGTLHLLGYDDQTPAQRARMRRRENALVRTLEVPFQTACLERPGKPVHPGRR